MRSFRKHATLLSLLLVGTLGTSMCASISNLTTASRNDSTHSVDCGICTQQAKVNVSNTYNELCGKDHLRVKNNTKTPRKPFQKLPGVKLPSMCKTQEQCQKPKPKIEYATKEHPTRGPLPRPLPCALSSLQNSRSLQAKTSKFACPAVPTMSKSPEVECGQTRKKNAINNIGLINDDVIEKIISIPLNAPEVFRSPFVTVNGVRPKYNRIGSRPAISKYSYAGDPLHGLCPCEKKAEKIKEDIPTLNDIEQYFTPEERPALTFKQADIIHRRVEEADKNIKKIVDDLRKGVCSTLKDQDKATQLINSIRQREDRIEKRTKENMEAIGCVHKSIVSTLENYAEKMIKKAEEESELERENMHVEKLNKECDEERNKYKISKIEATDRLNSCLMAARGRRGGNGDVQRKQCAKTSFTPEVRCMEKKSCPQKSKNECFVKRGETNNDVPYPRQCKEEVDSFVKSVVGKPSA